MELHFHWYCLFNGDFKDSTKNRKTLENLVPHFCLLKLLEAFEKAFRFVVEDFLCRSKKNIMSITPITS